MKFGLRILVVTIWLLLIVVILERAVNHPSKQRASTTKSEIVVESLVLKNTSKNDLTKSRIKYEIKFGARLITVETNNGRLGNKLFKYAAMFGIAMRYNFTPVIKNSDPIFQFIERHAVQAANVDDKSWKALNWSIWWESHANSYNQSRLESGLAGQDKIQLEIYLQSFRYFAGYEADVVSQFVFSQPILNSSIALVQSAIASMPRDKANWTIVGVHIRRGDYLQTSSIKSGYSTPGEAYYIKAVRFFTTRYTFVTFLVSSDDVQWARTFFSREFEAKEEYNNFVNFEYLSGSAHRPEQDLATLSLANHSILSAGSYSFWSAMLRQYRTGTSDGGTTVYYTKPFVVGTRIGNEYENSTENYYPPDWIGLD